MSNKLFLFSCLLTLLSLPSLAQDQAQPQNQYVGYFQMQSETGGDKASDLLFANIPPYVTTLILTSIQPDSQYEAGSLAVDGTGIVPLPDSQLFKDGIALAKKKAKVLIAVGSTVQSNWEGLNTDAIANFVKDFGFDGIDINFFVNEPNCVANGGQVACDSDQLYQDSVNALRQALPSPLIVSAAITGVGVYGEGDFADSQPKNNYTGFAVNLLKSDAGQSLDQVNLLGFLAGEGYDFQEGFNASKSYFAGKTTIGLGVPSEGADESKAITIDDIDGFCDFVVSNGGEGDGISLSSLDQQPDGSISNDNPDPNLVSQEVCNKFGLKNCDTPLGLSPNGSESSSSGKGISGSKKGRKCFRRRN